MTLSVSSCVENKTRFLKPSMSSKAEVLDVVVIVEYKIPLIEHDKTSTGQTITAEEIATLPTRNVNSIASTTAGVYQADEGDGLNIKGTRTTGTFNSRKRLKPAGLVSMTVSAPLALIVSASS